MPNTPHRSSHRLAALVSVAAAMAWCAAACSNSEGGVSSSSPTTFSVPSTTVDDPESNSSTAGPTVTGQSTQPSLTRPDWLGQRPLITDGSGFGVAGTTPPELVDRRLPTIDTLPPPDGLGFVSTIEPFTGEALARSTWHDECPVEPEDLAYVTVGFWGFDGKPHTGELVVAREWAEPIVSVFERAWLAEFPFEEMRIVTPADLIAEPTGDGNNTASFVCRKVTGGSRFSNHAFGLAIDVNPFHNPYQSGNLVLPELAGAYLQREDHRDGMLHPTSVLVDAFAEIGWSWGGDWQSLKDWQHFSNDGR